jgi:aspartyl aminopeptidase
MNTKEKKRATVKEIEKWLKSEGFKELTEEQKRSKEWKDSIESCQKIAREKN